MFVKVFTNLQHIPAKTRHFDTILLLNSLTSAYSTGTQMTTVEESAGREVAEAAINAPRHNHFDQGTGFAGVHHVIQ
jgi:hypothetical protein